MALSGNEKTRIGVGGGSRAYNGFTAKSATAVSLKHRSLYMAIEYEGILEVITPDDANDLPAKGMVYIGTTGDIKVTGAVSGTVILKNVPSGTWLNFCKVRKIFSTGTTATDIVLAR